MRTFFLTTALAAIALSPLAATPTADSPNHGFTIEPGTTAGTFVLEWWGIDEHIYFIEHSDDLMTWSFFPIYELGLDGPLSWGVSMTDDRHFYRAKFSDDPESTLLSTDYNGAMLSAWEQIQLGYNPFDWVDTNTNGIHDAWEEYHFGNLTTSMTMDLEPDGLLNENEFAEGTDPNHPDHPLVSLNLFTPVR